MSGLLLPILDGKRLDRAPTIIDAVAMAAALENKGAAATAALVRSMWDEIEKGRVAIRAAEARERQLELRDGIGVQFSLGEIAYMQRWPSALRACAEINDYWHTCADASDMPESSRHHHQRWLKLRAEAERIEKTES